jgi:hypothetical protein
MRFRPRTQFDASQPEQRTYSPLLVSNWNNALAVQTQRRQHALHLLVTNLLFAAMMRYGLAVVPVVLRTQELQNEVAS